MSCALRSTNAVRVALACPSPVRAFTSRPKSLRVSAEKWDERALNAIDKWASGSSGPPSKPKQKTAPAPERNSVVGDGVLILLALNFAVFALDKVLHMQLLYNMPLVVAKWQWWQFITSALCHANFEHLSNNMFMLYVFGKTVEEEEGALGVIATYLLCAVGGGIAFALLNPRGVLVGASGAVFGLIAVAALVKLRFSFRRLLELAAISPFIYTQLMSNVAAQWSGAGGSVAYIAHLGGAATGLVIVTLLSLLPADD